MKGKYDGDQVIDFLMRHLSRVENIRNHVLKEFYEETMEEREDFKNMVDEYLQNIRTYIDNKFDLNEGGQWPLILIGSVVEVQDLDYSEIDKLKIVPPFYEGQGGRLDCASCLSPVGNALLLKKIGDKVSVSTPLGDSNFMIKAIELPVK